MFGGLIVLNQGRRADGPEPGLSATSTDVDAKVEPGSPPAAAPPSILLARSNNKYLKINFRIFIIVGAGKQNRTAVSTLARLHNSRYTTPAYLIIKFPVPRSGIEPESNVFQTFAVTDLATSASGGR